MGSINKFVTATYICFTKDFLNFDFSCYDFLFTGAARRMPVASQAAAGKYDPNPIDSHPVVSVYYSYRSMNINDTSSTTLFSLLLMLTETKDSVGNE